QIQGMIETFKIVKIDRQSDLSSWMRDSPVIRSAWISSRSPKHVEKYTSASRTSAGALRPPAQIASPKTKRQWQLLNQQLLVSPTSRRWLFLHVSFTDRGGRVTCR